MDDHKEFENIFGTFYPRDFIVAVFDAEADRDAAATELQNAGMNDTRTASPQQVLDRYAEVQSHRNVAQRIGSALSSDEVGMEEDYVESARNGHFFLVVRADEQQIETVGPILFQHNAHGVKHYGEWVVTDLHRS